MSSLSWNADQERLLSRSVAAVARASAGTGKTTFIVEKVRRAVEAGTLSAERLLCITYTNKAAGELKTRLRAAFGDAMRQAAADAARAGYWRRQRTLLELAFVGTLHALAGQLLRQYPLQAGVAVNFRALDAQATYQLRGQAADRALRDWLNDTTHGDRRAELHVRYGTRDRGYQLGLMGCLRAGIEAFFRSGADLAALEGSLASNWAEDPNAGEHFAEALRLAVNHYRRLKGRQLDFDDLLVKAQELLASNPNVLADVQSRYELILLDEAQDTSPLQMNIVDLLAGQSDPAVAPSPKLCVVGDSKQAIYRFQGADHTRFLAVTQRLISHQAGGAAIINLRDNRRCSPGIVDFVNALSGTLLSRLGYQPQTDDLVARRPARPGAAVWHLREPQEATLAANARRYSEAMRLAGLIAHLTDPAVSTARVYDTDKPGDPGRVPRYGDVAILVARKRPVALYAQALAQAGIPYATEAGRGLYQSGLVADILALLRTLQDPRDTAAGAALLRHPVWGLSDGQWLALGLHDPRGSSRVKGRKTGTNAEGHPSTARLSDKSPTMPLAGFDLGWLSRAVIAQRQGPWREGANAANFRQLITVWRDLARAKDALEPATLVRRWWQDSGTLAMMAAGPQARPTLANAQRLLADIEQMFASDPPAGEEPSAGVILGGPRPALPQVIDELVRRQADAQQPEAGVVGPGDNVVTIMTAHKSKGLEFPVVILPDVAATADWMPTPVLLYSPEAGLVGKIFDPVAGKCVDRPAYKRWHANEKAAVNDDQRKLLYVAATRARDLLILSGEPPKRRTNSWLSWINESPATKFVENVSAADLAPAEPDPCVSAWPADVPLSPTMTVAPPWPVMP